MNNPESEKMKAIEQQVLSQNLMNFKNQLSTINVQLEELTRLKESLSELEGMKERKTHVSMGNGIFLEATLNEQKDNIALTDGHMDVESIINSDENISNISYVNHPNNDIVFT